MSRTFVFTFFSLFLCLLLFCFSATGQFSTIVYSSNWGSVKIFCSKKSPTSPCPVHCGVWLHDILLTQRSLTPLCPVHRGVWLHGILLTQRSLPHSVLPTAESVCTVSCVVKGVCLILSCLPQSLTAWYLAYSKESASFCPAYRRVCLYGILRSQRSLPHSVLPTAESDCMVSCLLKGVCLILSCLPQSLFVRYLA